MISMILNISLPPSKHHFTVHQPKYKQPLGRLKVEESSRDPRGIPGPAPTNQSQQR
ncbi:hypothetical protein BJX99DRAFT_151666 [Aspergillus californicus]